MKPRIGRKNKGKQEGNEKGIFKSITEILYCWILKYKKMRG